jgi:hypothetical protein
MSKFPAAAVPRSAPFLNALCDTFFLNECAMQNGPDAGSPVADVTCDTPLKLTYLMLHTVPLPPVNAF